MDEKIKKITDELKKVSLSESEKRGIRANLSDYAKLNPIFVGKPQISKFFIPAFATIILLAVGSLSYAAEKAVPGGFLYPIKTAINEPVLGLLSLGGDKKTDWSLKLVERRLSEIEALSISGSASEESLAEAKERISSEVDKLEEELESIRKSGNEEKISVLTKKIETVLENHLENLSGNEVLSDLKEDIALSLINISLKDLEDQINKVDQDINNTDTDLDSIVDNNEDFDKPVEYNTEITLHLNEKIYISESISAELTNFIFSPCPEGAVCIWDGLAVELTINYGDTEDKKFMNEGTIIEFPNAQLELVSTDYKTEALFKLTK